MATKAQNTKVGLFLLTSAALIGGSLFLLAGFNATSEAHYRLKFNRSILGLSTGSAVVYLGVPVGAVESIYVDADGMAIVDIGVDKERVTLHHGVTATLMWYSPVAGTMAINLDGGDRNTPPLPDDSFIPVKASLIASFAEVMESLLKKLDESMNEISSIAHSLQLALKGMGEGAFTEVVENINVLVTDSDALVRLSAETLQNLDLKLERALREFTELGKNLQYLTEDVGDAVESTKEFVDLATTKLEPLDLEKVQADLESAFSTIQQLGEKLDSSLSVVATVGETVIHEADTIERSVRESLLSLTEAVDAVKTLVEDLQEDPASLIRGRGKAKARAN